jgi:hypothetical protein
VVRIVRLNADEGVEVGERQLLVAQPRGVGAVQVRRKLRIDAHRLVEIGQPALGFAAVEQGRAAVVERGVGRIERSVVS